MAAPLFFASAAPSLVAGGPSTTPWVGPGGSVQVDHHLLLKVAHGVALLEGDAANGWDSTGVPEIDQLNYAYEAIGLHRVFPDPPAGHRDAALFRQLDLDRIYFVAFRYGLTDVPAVAAQYDALLTVQSSWADRVVFHCKTPNDPQWNAQWNLTPEDVNCEPGWDVQTASDVLVAIVDSGAELDHPDLDANVWTNPGEVPGNGKDDDSNGFVDDVHGWDFMNGDEDPTDDCGHGTHVSGIVGAEGDNGRDVAGVCWSAILLEVKVLDYSGAGTWTTIAQGITYAADNGAAVANYSLGGFGGDPAVDAAVQYAAGLDVVQVAAAGNNASSTPFYPAAYDSVISVMAIDIAEKRAAWSSYGDWCDLCAPGDGVTSLWPGAKTSALTGTSQASPHVAALAAMVRTANPQLDRVDTELVLEYSAKDLGGAGRDSTFQWGLADLHAALTRARSLSLSADTIAPLGTTDIFLAQPDSPGDVYLLLPGYSGRVPGFDLSTVVTGDLRVMPLNFDALSMASLNLPFIGVFVDFIGYLDANGQAKATLNVPGGKGFRDIDIDFSGLVFPVTDLSAPSRVLGSVVLKIR